MRLIRSAQVEKDKKEELKEEADLPEDFPGSENDWDLLQKGTTLSPEAIEQPPIPVQVPFADDDDADRNQQQELTQTLPPDYKNVVDENFISIPEPQEAPTPVDPSELFEEVLPPDTPEEERNKNFNIKEKLWYAINSHLPIEIKYQTLPTRVGAVFSSTRTVTPDYVYWAGTNRHILVGWCHLINGWRAFVVDRISDAKLQGDKNESESMEQ